MAAEEPDEEWFKGSRHMASNRWYSTIFCVWCCITFIKIDRILVYSCHIVFLPILYNISSLKSNQIWIFWFTYVYIVLHTCILRSYFILYHSTGRVVSIRERWLVCTLCAKGLHISATLSYIIHHQVLALSLLMYDICNIVIYSNNIYIYKYIYIYLLLHAIAVVCFFELAQQRLLLQAQRRLLVTEDWTSLHVFPHGSHHLVSLFVPWCSIIFYCLKIQYRVFMSKTTPFDIFVVDCFWFRTGSPSSALWSM